MKQKIIFKEKELREVIKKQKKVIEILSNQEIVVGLKSALDDLKKGRYTILTN